MDEIKLFLSPSYFNVLTDVELYIIFSVYITEFYESMVITQLSIG